MKKILFLLTLVIIPFSYLFYSCNKENLLEEIDKNPIIYNSDEMDFENPSNPNNEYDSFGIHHNFIVQGFIDNELLNLDSFNLQEIFDIIELDSIGRVILGLYFWNSEIEMPQFDQAFNNWYQIRPFIFDYYDELRDILSENSGLQNILDAITVFEATYNYEAINDNDLIKCLKISSSIARYSAYLWAPEEDGGLGYAEIIGRSINWNKFARSDIWGAALAGFTTGNPAVALGWGVGCSVVSAADDYFD